MHTEHTYHKKDVAFAFLLGAAATAIAGGYYLFGKDGKRHRAEVEHWMLKAKTDILDQMRTAEDMTETEYHKIVDRVMASYASAKEVGQERADHAAAAFKRKWERMREASDRAAEKARQELKREEDTRLAMTSEEKSESAS
ncbi:MAG: hypothetical protein AAB582_01990 [Patescibacteria group bacterium]